MTNEVREMKGIFIRKEQRSLKLAEKLEYNCGIGNFEVREAGCKEICDIVNSSCNLLLFEDEIFRDCFYELSKRLHWTSYNSGVIEVKSVNPMTHVVVNYNVHILCSNENNLPFELFGEQLGEDRIVAIMRAVMRLGGCDKVCDFFKKVGLFPNLNGYAYLLEAIKCVARSPKLLRNLTKELYPMVGETFGVSGSVVERGIRNAVDSMMSKGKFQETANGLYGGNFGKYEKPTNGEFISFLTML